MRNCLNASAKEQRAALRRLRLAGISKYNAQIAAGRKDAVIHRERLAKNTCTSIVSYSSEQLGEYLFCYIIFSAK